MTVADGDFEDGISALLPQLRGAARRLLRGSSDADDLVQDTILRMWQARDRFQPGTDLRAWAFTILRNRFYNAFLPQRRLSPIDDVPQHCLAVPALQERRAQGVDIRRAIFALDVSLRQVLALTVGAGLAYDDAARVIGCPVGTIKSRVFRARRELRRLLDRDDAVPLLPRCPGQRSAAARPRKRAQGRFMSDYNLCGVTAVGAHALVTSPACELVPEE